MMSRITEYLIRYPIWVSVIMFSLFGFGLLSFSGLRFSFFPDIEPDTVVIQVAYPGASPEEVAEGVVLKIEENLDGLEGVDRVTSISRENFGTVNVEVEFEDNLLTVKTKQVNKSEDNNESGEIIHKGISQRQFARSFTIADDVKVEGAELKDGLLTIACERIVPEYKKKKLIEIK